MKAQLLNLRFISWAIFVEVIRDILIYKGIVVDSNFAKKKRLLTISIEYIAGVNNSLINGKNSNRVACLC